MENIAKEKIEELKEELSIEELERMTQDVNSWNGALDWLEMWENDEEFFNTFFYNNVIEAVRATAYGDYNYNDEYVRIDAYGNLESLSEWEREQELKDYSEEIIEAYIENIDEMYDDEIKIKVQNAINEE